jgi:DNA-binding transcriptional ArsR family regulator
VSFIRRFIDSLRERWGVVVLELEALRAAPACGRESKITMLIVFDVDDLASVQIGQLDPLVEVGAAAHRSLNRPVPLLRTWAKETGERLGSAGQQGLQDLRSAIVQIANFGVARNSGSAHFEDALVAALSQPTRHWETVQREMSVFGQSSPTATWPGFLSRLERSASQYYQAALARHWKALITEAELATASWTTTIRRQGIGAMFNALHPDISWQPPLLSVLTVSQAGHCLPGCPHQISRRTVESATAGQDFLGQVSSEGLTIIPSIFSSACNVDGNVYPGPRIVVHAIIVPVPIHPELFRPTGSGSQYQLLDQLIGMTRACVLLACLDQELTTSQLARTVGISVSSASEHAAILRSTGLLSSRRERNTVIHAVTELGRSLVQGRAQENEIQPVRLLGAN